MEDLEQRPGESLIDYASRRRRLPTDHPAHLTIEQAGELAAAQIAALQRRAAAIQRALKATGINPII
jgi:2'-5' RNA ligase